jgi:hypothetical protein
MGKVTSYKLCIWERCHEFEGEGWCCRLIGGAGFVVGGNDVSRRLIEVILPPYRLSILEPNLHRKRWFSAPAPLTP